MKLEDYFIFLSDSDIRLKDTRIGIETILYDYIYRSQTAEEIANRFPALSLEQVYATLLYYLHNKEAVSKYISDWLEWGFKMREQQKQNPPSSSSKISQLRSQRLASGESYTNEVFVR